MDAQLRFQNGAVMVARLDAARPPQVFVLPTAEGATFHFSLTDVLADGQLVYREWLTQEPETAVK